MRKKVLLLLSVLLVFMTTTAFSALSQSLTITSEVKFRVLVDIRVNGVALNSATNGAVLGYESDYSKNTVSNGFVLPNSNSSISYTVHIDNNGNVDYSIYDILKNSSDNGLQVAVSGYNIGDVIPHNSSLDLVLTYTTTNPSENVINVVDTFNFKRVYYVTYETNTSDTIPYQLKYEGIPLTLTSTQPTKTGYTFSKWNTKSDGTGVNYTSGSSYTADEDRKLYALYTLDTYNITYVLAGGTNDQNNPTTYTYESSDITLGDATKTGYTFKGWTGNGTTTPTKNLVLPHNSTGNKTFTANFRDETPPTVEVTNQDKTVDYLEKIYNINVGYNKNNADVKVYIDAQDVGSGVDKIEYVYSDSTTVPSTGWTETTNGALTVNKVFGNYYLHVRATDIANNTTTVTTKLIRVRYIVVYYDDYNVSTSASKTDPYYYGKNPLTSRTPTAVTGYTFDGWYNKATGGSKIVDAGVSYTPTTSIRLYGKWTAIEYDILYTLHNGINNANNPSKYTIETNDITLGDASKTLTFVGHYNATSGANAANGEVTIGANTTADQAFAGWTGNGTTTPTKNLVLPTGSTGNKSYEAHWTAVAGTVPTVTRTGYTCGWSTSSTGTTIEIASGGSYGTNRITEGMGVTVNLYAVCNPNTYTVTAKANGGSISSTSGWTGTGNTATKSVTYDQAYGTLPTISRPGYTFKGWNGRNILDLYNRSQGTLQNNGFSYTNPRDFEFDKYYIGITTNNYFAPSNVASAELSNNVWSIMSKGSGYGVGFPVSVSPNTKYMITYNNGGSNDSTIGFGCYDSSGNYINQVVFQNNKVTTLDNCTIMDVVLRPSVINVMRTYSDIQVYEENIILPYEPYYLLTTTNVTRASNHEINAIWERNNYTITYALNNGTVATANPTNYNVETETFTLNNPTKTITFVGHYNATSGANAANGQVTIGSNTTAVQTFKGWSGTDLTGETNKTVTVSQGSTGNRSYTAHWTSVAPTSLPTVSRTGYTCGWSTSSTGTTIQYDNSGNKNYTANLITEGQTATVNLYAVCEPNTYTIGYTMNGGTKGTNAPTTGTFDSDVVVSKPSKTFTVNINGNGQNATVKNAQGTVVSNASSQQTFAGWTATDLDTSTAKYGAAAHPTTSWNGTTKVGSSADPIYLLNLRSESGTVTLKANWTAVNVTLPNLTKTGYQCKFNTSDDGTGTNYASGASYTPSTTTNSATLYVICTPNKYNIAYTLNGGTQGANAPTTGTYDQNVVISNPTKTVTITGNVNGTGATVGNPTSSTQTFAGWSSTSIGTTAQTGSTASNYASWNGTTKTKNTYFKNLADTNNATVTMVANWTPVAITNGLPTLSKVGYNCKWYTEATGGSELGAGGASYTPAANSADSITVFARCTERDDTAYRVNHYVHDLETNTYTLDSHDDLTGTTNATLTVANLKKTISGFTYVDGYITGNTTKPTSGAVTTTTILPDGSRVINLYYRRNYLYVQYHVNGGTLNTSNSAYGVSNNLITHTANTTATNFLLGVYESKVGPVNTSTYAIGSAGLHNYNNPSVVNIEYTGYQAKSGAHWNTNAQGTGTSYDQNDQTIDANGFAGADLTTGDAVVTLYVNWTPVNYTLTYALNNGTVTPTNPTTYNIESSDITLNNPTKTLTFKGNANATSGANAASGTVTIGSNTTKDQTFAGWSESLTNLMWTKGFIDLNTGVLTTNSDYPNSYYTSPIKLKSGVQYTLSGFGSYSTGSIRWRLYNTDGTYWEGTRSSATYTPTKDCYVRILFYNNPTAEQLEGTVLTSGTTKPITIPTGSTGNRSYTAHWTAVAGTVPTVTRTGYTCGWSTSSTGTTIEIASGGSFATSRITEGMAATVNLYAVCEPNTYTISYTMNGGPNPTTKPTTGTYDANVNISNPGNKSVTFTGNANGTGATIGSAATGTQTFSGWTSSTVGSNAKTGPNTSSYATWTGTSTKNTYFKNLTDTNHGTVTMVANWSGTVTLPTATKTGYTCKWYSTNGNSGGSLIGNSGGSYNIPSDSPTAVTIYARCTINQYTLTINPNSGTWNNTTSNTTVTQNYGTTYNVTNNPTRTGYIFGGWKLTSGNGDITYFQDSEKVSQYIINSTSAAKPAVYNNKGNGSVTFTNQADSTSSTGYSMRITTNGEASPYAGGFYNVNTAVAGAIYYHKIVAKVPTGYSLHIVSNSMGVGYGSYWLTSNAGTGDWQTYIYATYSGYNGPFSTFGHVYLNGSDNQNVTWYVNESTMYRKGANLTETQASNIIFGFVDSNATLTAQWSSSGVTVTWGTQNGTLGNGTVGTKWASSTAFRYASTYTGTKKAPNYISDSDFGIYRTGYTFGGWYTATNGGTQVFDSTGQLNASVSGYSNANKVWQKYDENVTLYAKWTKAATDLTVTAPAAVIYNGSAQSPAPTVKDGSTTLTSGTDYTVSHSNNTNVGTATATITGKNVYNSTTKAYYTGTTTVSYYINNATLTFNKGTCDDISGSTTLYTKKGATGVYTGIRNTTAGTLPTASKTGYTFQGWYTSSSNGTKVLNADGSFTGTAVTNYTNATSWQTVANQTLYAVCTPNTYTVTANANGGSISSTTGWTGTGNTATKSVTYDQAYGTLPTVSKSGYTFGGWSYGTVFTGKTSSAWGEQLIDNSTLTSKLTAGKSYKVEYDITLNEAIPSGYEASQTGQWGSLLFRSGTTGSFTYTGMSGNLYSLCGSNYTVGQKYHISGTITTPSDLSTAVMVFYTARSTQTGTSTGYQINGTISGLVFYENTDTYGNIDSSTVVKVASDHEIKSNWSINNPATPTITGGETKVYGAKATTLTCSTSTNYASETTKYYSFGYATSDGGTPSNWTTASTTNTLSIAADAYVGQRWYSCRVYASDGDQTTRTVASAVASDTEMTINNAKITWDVNSCGTISGTSPAYVRKGRTIVFTGIRNSTVGTMASVSKTGYTFNGWYDGTTKVINANGTIEASVSNWTDSSRKWLITADKTLKASCTRDSYTITYALNNGTNNSNNPSTYTVESSAITLASPTKTLIFKGNANATSGANAASGTVTIGANTTQAQTFAGWSGTGLSSNTINVTIPTGSTGDRSYTAHWTAVAPAKLPKVEKTGYTCGWSTTNTGTTIEYESEATNYPTSLISEGQAATVNLYAVCTPNTYTLTINPNGGTYNSTTSNSTKTMTYDSSNNNDIGVPTRSGYTFDGWYIEANSKTNKLFDNTGKNTNLSGYFSAAYSTGVWKKEADVTIYAHWSKAVTATTNSISPTSYIYDATAKSPTPTVKDGSTTLTSGTDYTISYTNNTNVGTATATITGKNVYNSTTKAYYTGTTTINFAINNAKLTFNKGTCDATSGTTTLYTKKGATGVYTGIQNTTAGTIPTASKTGYTFDGWYTASSNGTKVLNADGSFTGTGVTNYTNATSWQAVADQTLYARCSASSYKLIKVSNDDNNLIKNGSFESYQLIDAQTFGSGHTWDKALNGVPGNTNKAYASTFWGTGLNRGIPVPEVGYHAHMRIVDNNAVFRFKTNEDYEGNTGSNVSGGPAVAGTITTGRWLGIAHSITGTNLTAGKKYTISLDMYRVSGTNTARVGLIHASGTSTSMTFSSGQKNLSPTTTGQWQRLSYTFTLSSNYNNAVNPALYIYGHGGGAGEFYVDNISIEETVETNKNYDTNYTSSELATPTKTGYTFVNWSNGKNNTALTTSSKFTTSTADFENAGTAGTNAHIYAKWTPKTYTLTINPQGGTYNSTTSNSTKTMTYDSSNNNDIGVPTRDGYTFAGWYTAANGGTQLYSTNGRNVVASGYWSEVYAGGAWIKDADVTVYAHWTKAVSSLTNSVSPTSYIYDGTAKSPTPTVKDGSTTLTSGTDYTISYSNNINVGTATATITGKSAYNATTKAYYTGTTTITYYINNATLTFDKGSCSSISGTTPLYTKKNATKVYTTIRGTTEGTIPTASKTGYTFNGWYTASSGGSKVLNANGTFTGTAVANYTNATSWQTVANQTLYAQCGRDSYSITYSMNNGTNNSNNPSTYNVESEAITLAAPTKTLTFKGNYNATSGANAASGSGVTIGSNTTKAQTFAGWSGTGITGNSTSVTIPTGSTGNRSYTAHWTAVAGTVPTVTRTGYTCGWSTSSTGTTIEIASGGSFATSRITEGMAATVNLYAVCTPNTYTVTANANGGSIPSTSGWTVAGSTATKSVTYDQTYGTLPTPTRTGYTFEGWTNQDYVDVSELSSTSVRLTNAQSYRNPDYIYNVNEKVVFDVTFTNNTVTGIDINDISVDSSDYTNSNGRVYGKVPVTLQMRNRFLPTYNYKFFDIMTSDTISSYTINKFLVLTESDTNMQIDSNHTLYAHWSKPVSDLTNTVSPTSYIYDGTAKSPTLTVKDGSTTLTNNTDYSVTYSNNTNVGTATATVTGKNITNNTTRASYTGATTVSYYINNATLTFNKGTCDDISGSTTLYTKKGATGVYTGIRNTTAGTLPTASKTGYTFQGWYNASSNGTKVLNADGSFTGTAVSGYTTTNAWATTANQTLYAHCTPNSYTVTANANGGSISSTTGWTGTGATATKSVTYDSAYGTLPTVSRAGYTFKGWNGKNLFETGVLADYYIYNQSGMNVSISGNTITSTILSGQMASIRNEKHSYTSGTYTLTQQSTGNKRHLIYPYDANGNLLTNSNITISGWVYNSSYRAWYNNSATVTVTIPSTVDHWKYGMAFVGTEGNTLQLSDIQIEEGATATPYEPYYISTTTLVTTAGNHTIYAVWKDETAPTKPTIVLKYADNSGTYTSGTWTNKQVATVVSTTDEGSGVTSIPYNIGSGWTTGASITNSGSTYTKTESWTVTDGRNVTVKFKAIDAEGNESAESDSVNIKYDISGPTITASNITYGSNLSITLADAYSGVVGWQVTSSSTAPTSGWTSVTKTASTTVTKSGLVPGTYYVWSIDDVGNKNSKQVTVSKKPVTVTAGSSNRAWNGSALTNSTCAAGSNQLLSGHTVTCTMTSASTITVASTTIGTSASVNNVIDTVTIKDANNNNVTSYYNVTKANGTLTISYATPTISLTAKTANWTGSAIAANAASASPNSSPTFTYTYYTDSSCSTQTTTSHGASATGGAPSLAGQYYVKATAAAVSTKTNTASSACTSHKINAATPTVSLSPKEATYTGSAIAANTATVSPNSNPTITYTYYTNSGCTTQTGTTVATGLAASAGAAPVVAGQYYVKASAAAVTGKTAAATSGCISHKINPKAITVTAGSSSRAWNGSALTNSSCTANSIGTGDAITCAMTSASTITLASTTIGTSASVNNVINTVTIKKGTTDVSASYIVTKANGTLTISYATPTISLTAKTANWTGSAIAANAASASPNSSPTFSYVYYTDSSCSTQTTTSHGASAAGGAPSVAGQYYVKANAAAVSQKTNAASSACTSHKINAATPTVSLTAKTATYTGSAIAANTATVSPNSNPTITYTYYTNSGCTTQTGTTVATGLAASAGAAPVVAGQYYVKASAAAVTGKTAAASSSCVSHKINPKAVTVTAGSDSRAWNGSALTKSSCTANSLGTGDAVTCAMTSASTITLASTTIGTSASVNNVINTVTIKKGSNDVSASYTITKANGTLTISYATPTISLTAKTANWTGSAIAANTASASPNSSPTFSYVYYTDSSCSTQTTTSHGASAAGGAPSLAGQYYVKANAAAVSQKTNAASSACTSHKINAPVPTVTLTAKEATYTGSAIAANTATVSPNSNPTITYTYYTDSSCSTKTGTTVATGLAASAGAAPVVAGQYYVKASAAAVTGKTAAGSSSCVSHKITPKAVTVTAGTSSRAWNGSALTNSSCTANALGTGDSVTCTMTSASTITLASTTIGTSASQTNTINTVTIKKGSNDVTASYTVTKATGTLTISYATPTISLTAKTANWTGSVIAANTATASPNSSPTFTYTYYTDSSCSTQTTTSHGASAAGGAPSVAGQYYVKASAAAVSQKTNAASSACTSHKINAATPTVSLTAKTATYTGSAIAANTATVSPNSNPTITYTYYTNSGCTTQTGTTVATGLAASAGAAPVVAGQYYVKASAAAVSGKTNAASSACVSHKINPKAVTVTAGSTSRAWNGSALTNSSCTANALGTGDAVTCAMTSASTITLASTTIGTSASVNNVINTVTIKKGSNDVSASYTVTKANGTLTISYATPTISLTAKTANWTGSAIAANAASASPNSSPTFSYVYYTDSSCSTQTTTSHGASAAGGAPSVAGQYYVKANAAAVSQKTNAASSACTSHKINAPTPTVSLSPKEATYTGSAITANTATVSPNSNPTITYTYYTNSGCTTKTGTTVATGLAASAGAAPVVAGQYYVKASAAAVTGKTAAGSSSCVSHKINPKAVTVTAGTSSRDWNGSALTNSTCTANALGTGDAVTCAMTSASTITLASTTIGTSASVNNVINTVTIKKGSNDVSASYTVTKANGTLTVSYKTPTVSLTARTAAWTGSAIAANTATVSPNSNPTITYTYYTNNTCTTTTTTSHGASAAGGAPSVVGNYYVKASAAAVSQKTNAASSTCVAHTITASTPTVSLTPKETTYTGAAIAANTATVSPNSNPTITYAYYTDSGCSTATTAANSGAASNGAAPVFAGQYYVKASAAAVTGKTAAATSGCISHKINKKAVTVTAGTSSRAWNGSALTNSGCTANALGTGDSVTCTMTSGSTITLASTTIGTSASQTNTIDTVTIKKGTVNVSNSYTITKATGTLTISYANPTVTLSNKETAYTGSAISINAPTINPNSTPTLTYNYYTDSTCATATTTSNSGAAGTGKPPVYAGQYYAKVSATAVSQKTNAANSNCASLKITKITCPAPTGVSITTAGVVSWTAASGASSYQISIDNTNWTTASSGVNYKSTITAATGTRTVYVRSVCSATNYTSTSSANGTASTTVFSVGLTKGTGISAVSGGGNYITGATAAIDATVKAGYTWTNWTGTSTLTSKSNNITVNGNKSYTANATANTYTVAYNCNGGTGSTASSSHTYDVAKALTSNGCSKEGYAFAGWATSSSGAVAYSNGQSVSNLTTTNGATVTLYAKWNQSTYTMTINPNGGTYNNTTSTSTKTMKYDTTNNNDIGVPTYSGYTFQGWYTAQTGGSLIYGTNGRNVALNGYWDAAYNTGKWKKASNLTIWARWAITDPGTPTITGGTTKIYGASATTLTCTENTTYPSGFTKYYEFGYASSASGTPSSWSTKSTTNTYTISTAAGTEFVGTRYYKCRVHIESSGVSSNNVVATSATTMTINNATITLSAGSGTTACSTISGQSPSYVNTSMTGVYTSASGTTSGTIPTASKNGYTFSGFYDGNTQVINGSGQIVASVSGWTDANKKWTITTNKTLTAKCSENSYSISYTMNNGTCTTTRPTSYTINSSAITLPTSCSKTLSFVPHYSTNASSNATSSSGVSYGSTTTAAQTWIGWTGSNGTTAQKTVTIPAGSTGNKSYALRFTAVAGTLPTVSRGGYTCGWNANDGQTTRTWGSGGTYATTSITEGMATTVNVYAVCNPNTYTVSFSRNCPSGTGSGGQTADVTATYNAAMPAITATAPTCSYYTFGGWYDTSAASGGTQYYTAAGASARSWNKTAATTLYGRWTPVNYTITYNLNNCGTVSGTNPTSYNYASAAITLKNPSKTGYTFTGWTGSNGTTAQTTVTIPNHSNGNKSYTANCTINKYYIDLNAVIGGKSAGNTSGCGKVDLYINGTKVANQQTDHYQQYNYGTTWKVNNITTSNAACSRSGLATEYSGTVGTSNVNIGVQWSVPTKTYGYTGGMQSYTVPVTGNYRLTVWGAQGNYGYGATNGGGYGGKSVGTVNSLAAGSVIYIGVGGGNTNTANGGYNGGGTGNYIAGDNGFGGGGGGATHMAKTQSALLRNTTPANVYIVAGGGGGSSEASYDHSTFRRGGSGGGTSGGSGAGGSYIGGGATQDNIGVRGDSDCANAGFGYGGSSPYGSTTESTYGAGGGGAGWYGGGASSHSSGGTYSTASSGGGGSGRLSGFLASGATTTAGQRSGAGSASVELVG